MGHSGPIRLLDGTVEWHANGEVVETTYPARLLDDGMPTWESYVAGEPHATEAQYAEFCDWWREASEELRERAVRYLADQAAMIAESKAAHDEALAKAGLVGDAHTDDTAALQSIAIDEDGKPRGAFDDFADQLDEMGETIVIDEDEEQTS